MGFFDFGFENDIQYNSPLEIKNFKVPSNEWINHSYYCDRTGLKRVIKVSPKGDILEDEKGDQVFTFEAALRETKKYGKKIPTVKDFSEIINSGCSENLYDNLKELNLLKFLIGIKNNNNYNINFNSYSNRDEAVYWTSNEGVSLTGEGMVNTGLLVSIHRYDTKPVTFDFYVGSGEENYFFQVRCLK